MSLKIFTFLLVTLVLTSFLVKQSQAQRQCNDGSTNCLACVCHQKTDTADCCKTSYNSGNGNCEGILKGKNGAFKKCCNGRQGFARCW